MLAFASAATFALSTSVQHRVAELAPTRGGGFAALVRHLLTHPAWLLAQGVAATGLALHAAALHFGPIALVQPIVISGIVLIVPIRAALSRRLPSMPELRAVAVTACALGLFLVAAHPGAGERAALDERPLVFAGSAVVVALAVGAASRLTKRLTRRAFLLGITSGVLFGLLAGLLKLTLQVLADGGVLGMLSSWTVYAVVAAGVAGVLTNQLAYRTAHLSASMPVLHIVDGMVALAAGFYLFAEAPRTDPGWLVVQAVALGGVALGLRMVAVLDRDAIGTSDVVHEDGVPAAT